MNERKVETENVDAQCMYDRIWKNERRVLDEMRGKENRNKQATPFEL